MSGLGHHWRPHERPQQPPLCYRAADLPKRQPRFAGPITHHSRVHLYPSLALADLLLECRYRHRRGNRILRSGIRFHLFERFQAPEVQQETAAHPQSHNLQWDPWGSDRAQAKQSVRRRHLPGASMSIAQALHYPRDYANRCANRRQALFAKPPKQSRPARPCPKMI